VKNDPSFKDYQLKIDNWILDHGGYWPPLSMLSALIEEIGELARIINNLEGFKPYKEHEESLNLGEELADIFYALICIANYYKIDIDKELDKVINKISKRDSKRFL
jgi:NTP pyrophosphatase (non-canonical NTP hydrolase)